MKLSKLPYLCQRNIFKQMHFSTRYTFTFGTRQMKIWAKRLQITLKTPELQVEIGNNDANVSFFAKSGERQEKIMDLSRWWCQPDEIRVMKFNDMELECVLTFTKDMYLKYDQRLPPTTRILESLCDFFNTTKDDVVYIITNLGFLDHLPPIPIRKSVVRQMTWRQSLDQIDQFYSSYPLQHFSMVSAERDQLEMPSTGSRVLRTRNLILSNVGQIFYLLLTRFHGENAVFTGIRIRSHCINQFLKFWLTQYSGDLKTIIVEVATPITQVEEVFTGIEHTKEKKGARYPYSSVIQEYYDFPEDAFDCSNTYTIAKSAGPYSEKKATVKLTPHFFMFLVWD